MSLGGWNVVTWEFDAEPLNHSHVRYPVRRISGISSCIIAAVSVSAAVSTAGAQAGGGLDACAIFNAQELVRLSGLRDVLGRGPQLAAPADLPKGRSECEFLGITFGLDASMTRDWFGRTRADQVKNGTKVEPIPGLGDEAYYWWDPKPGSYRQVHRSEDGYPPAHAPGPDEQRLHSGVEGHAARDREVCDAEVR
jgi:hypothetical protein